MHPPIFAVTFSTGCVYETTLCYDGTYMLTFTSDIHAILTLTFYLKQLFLVEFK